MSADRAQRSLLPHTLLLSLLPSFRCSLFFLSPFPLSLPSTPPVAATILHSRLPRRLAWLTYVEWAGSACHALPWSKHFSSLSLSLSLSISPPSLSFFRQGAGAKTTLLSTRSLAHASELTFCERFFLDCCSTIKGHIVRISCIMFADLVNTYTRNLDGPIVHTYRSTW